MSAEEAEPATADMVAKRATYVITSMGADIRRLTFERDRYRAAWLSARRRAMVPAKSPRTAGALTVAAQRAADKMRDTSPDGRARLQRPLHPAVNALGNCVSCGAAVAVCPDHGTATCPSDSDCHRLMSDPYSDGVPDHQYHESCPGTCCGGNEEPVRFGHVFQTVAGDVMRTAPDATTARCEWLPGDAVTSCDFDPECPVHGERHRVAVDGAVCVGREPLAHPNAARFRGPGEEVRCCNPVDGRCGGAVIGTRCVKAGGCCYSKNAVCPKHH